MVQNELIGKRHEKVCTTLNYIEDFLIALTVIGCISIFGFTSLVVILIRITSSAKGLKIFTIIVGIKKYKSIIK